MLILALLLFVAPASFADTPEKEPAKEKEYGSSGDFEFSTGLSLLSLNFSKYGNNYNFGMLPFANHFLWNRVYARYNFGLLFNYNSIPDYNYYYLEYGIEPGIALGYSFSLWKNWYLNLAGGYQATIAWFKGSYIASDVAASNHLVLYPELKFFATRHWSLSLLTRVSTFASGVSTNTYIIVSYLF